jgi:carboxyl-terminal processing protease
MTPRPRPTGPSRLVTLLALTAMIAAAAVAAVSCGEDDGPGSGPSHGAGPTGGTRPGKAGATVNSSDPAATQVAQAGPGRPAPAASPLPGAQAAGPAAEETPAEPFTHPRQSFEAVRDLLIKSYYREGLTDEDLYRAAVRGMLEHVDPAMHKWNRLLPPRQLAQLHADLKGEIVGVGIEINFDSDTGHAEVLGVVPGTPAERGGLMRGDRIVNVNGKRFKGRSTMDIVAEMRGLAGQPVKLTVLRGDELLRFELVREKVAFVPVRWMALPDGIGYIHIQGFSEKTAPAVSSALDELEKLKVRALVIDLRTNQGGAFDEAVNTASLLLPEGTGIVRVRKRGQTEELHSSKGPGRLAQLPMAVLIEHATSSGGEFVAAALKEGRAATLVGHRTHGKWSVQKLWELENGYAVKYTVGLFESPSGQRYDRTGLPADVEVTMEARQVERTVGLRDATERLAADTQLRTAVRLLAAR